MSPPDLITRVIARIGADVGQIVAAEAEAVAAEEPTVEAMAVERFGVEAFADEPGVQVFTQTVSGRPTDWPVPSGHMHFRLEDQFLGKLDLSCDNGYVVRDYEFGFPEVRSVVYPNSLDDGTYDLTRYIGSRAVTLNIVLRPTDSPTGVVDVRVEAQMRDALLAFVHPYARPRLLFSEHGDDRVRFISLRGEDAPYTISRPRFNELSVSWVAPRGYIQSPDIVFARVSFTEALAQSYALNLFNPGNAPAHWVAHIEGELTNPRFTLGDESDGNHLQLNYALQAGQGAIDIDSYTRSVFIGQQLSGYRYLEDESTWFTIPPGHSVVTVTHESAVRLGYPYALWQPASGGAQWSASGETDAGTRLVPAKMVANTTPPPDQVADWANLAALKADPVYGDGDFTGTFRPGEFIVLRDETQAWYNGTIWQTGAKPWANPAPGGSPPWSWSTKVDPTTGLPPIGEVLFYLHPAWL